MRVVFGRRGGWEVTHIRLHRDRSDPGRVPLGIVCAILAMLAGAFAEPAYAKDKIEPQKPISEAEVQFVSEVAYTGLLRQALSKGWRFSPENIENGYRRHFEELKLQLINRGYTILAGEVGV